MSKMSQLYMELSEQASDLGYETLERAFDDGWQVDYDRGVLHKRMTLDELNEAHEALIRERDELIKEAEEAIKTPSYDRLLEAVVKLLKFIKEA